MGSSRPRRRDATADPATASTRLASDRGTSLTCTTES